MRRVLLPLVASGFLTSLTVADFAIAQTSQAVTPAQDAIDYTGFMELTEEVAAYRQTRLLPRDDFLAMAAREDALLLDTRSSEAFAAGHIDGAVNLPFSDFTDEKLRDVIGEDTQRSILIYCNNNFSDDAYPILLKRAPLALNIPTFINLVGYGYRNVWELDGVMSVSEVPWTGTGVFGQLETFE